MTLADRLSRARAALVAAGIPADEAAVDVDVYAREILGWDRARLLSELRGAVPDSLEPTLSGWLDRRARREPTAYIVGRREFWGLPFTVTGDVLIPRPETELLVEEALTHIPHNAVRRVADIGTGSGCIAVAIAHSAPSCTVLATDVSDRAIAIAAQNAAANGVAERVTFRCTSYLDGVDEVFDVIVANPPYVKAGDRPGLGPGVRYEPEVALFGGADGLRDIAGVLRAADRTLAADGWAIMEFGFGQDEEVARLVAEMARFELVTIRNDLQGIPRTVTLRRRHGESG